MFEAYDFMRAKYCGEHKKVGKEYVRLPRQTRRSNAFSHDLRSTFLRSDWAMAT